MKFEFDIIELARLAIRRAAATVLHVEIDAAPLPGRAAVEHLFQQFAQPDSLNWLEEFSNWLTGEQFAQHVQQQITVIRPATTKVQ